MFMYIYIYINIHTCIYIDIYTYISIYYIIYIYVNIHIHIYISIHIYIYIYVYTPSGWKGRSTPAKSNLRQQIYPNSHSSLSSLLNRCWNISFDPTSPQKRQSWLQCVVVCCSVLQCVAVCCSETSNLILHYHKGVNHVVLCCSVVQ